MDNNQALLDGRSIHNIDLRPTKPEARIGSRVTVCGQIAYLTLLPFLWGKIWSR